jgi:hypothetical protein
MLGPKLVPGIIRRPKRYGCTLMELSQVVIAAVL